MADLDDQELKAELDAIGKMIELLTPLSETSRVSVIEFVFKRMGLAFPLLPDQPHLDHLPGVASEAPSQGANLPPDPLAAVERAVKIVDLFTLKEAKQPKSASEMIALVAYYLAHEAPTEDRREDIGAEDIPRYFREAKYPLPSAPAMALVHAKNAGYLTSPERGRYRLSAVGHNLVAHRMGSAGQHSPASRSKPRKAQRKSTGNKKRGR